MKNGSLLATLFSEESKANYERINKPQELKREKRVREENQLENNDGSGVGEELPKKVKKPKHKHRNQNQNQSQSQSQSGEGLLNENNSTETENVDNTSAEKNDKDGRTIFVGNIPITETVNSLKVYFGQFGPVESVRLRSVPIAGTAVDDHGNQELVKKICVNQGKFGDQKGSFNAYVVFKTKGSVQASFAANNRILGNRHLRIDSLHPTLYPPRTSVFLGGLPFYTDEEELREHFAKLLPNGQDDISGIRLIRDQETLVGKGIGYLALANHEAVMKALLLDKSKFKKREIRVSSCGKRTKRTEQIKKQNNPSVPTNDSGTPEQSTTTDPTASSSSTTPSSTPSTPSMKRKREDKKSTPKSNPALKRMQMKKAIQQIVKKNAQSNPHNKNKKTKSKSINVKQAVRKLERMNKKK